MPVIAPAVVSVVATVFSAGNKARDRKIRRQFEQNLAALDIEQKRELEKKVVAAKNLEEKKRIIAENLGRETEARIKSIQEKNLEQKRVKNNLMIVGAISVAVIIVALIVYRKKRK